MTKQQILDDIVRAIADGCKVRLVYRREDGVVSVHEVAPIDVRPGDTAKTRETLYLWAWCYAEDKAETHIVARIERVIAIDTLFDPSAVLASWPTNWPLPPDWFVPREWP